MDEDKPILCSEHFPRNAGRGAGTGRKKMKSGSDRNEEEVAGKVSESRCGTQNILVYSCGNESRHINKPHCGAFHVSPFVITLFSSPLNQIRFELKGQDVT